MADLAAAVVEQEPQQRRYLICDAFRRYRAEHEDKTPYRLYSYDSTGETIIDNRLYDDIAEHIGEVRGKVVEFRRKLKAILKENDLSDDSILKFMTITSLLNELTSEEK